MALPLPFDTQGFPVVNAIVQGGGIIIPAVDLEAHLQSKPAPDPSAIDSAVPAHLQLDPDHALRTRARVLTDEGTFAGNFPGASLYRALTGGANITMTAASTAVTGVGTLFTTEVRVGDYIEITAQHSDTVPVLAQVQSIESNLALTLRTAWAGVTATGAAQVCDWYVIRTAGAGDAIAVAANCAQLTVGVVNGSRVTLARRLGPGGRKGCPPVLLSFYASRSAANGDQVAVLGVTTALGSALAWTDAAFLNLGEAGVAADARFYTLVGGIAANSGARTLPLADLTTAAHWWAVYVHEDQVEFWCEGRIMWSAPAFIVDPYDELYVVLQVENTAVPAAGATLNVYDVRAKSADVLDTRPVQPDAEKLHVTVHEGSAFANNTPRAPTNIADNLVHEITDAAGYGMQVGKRYCVTQIGGADIQVYAAGAAPAIAVLRRSPYHLFNGIPWVFSPTEAAQHLYAGKAVDDTANADLYVDSPDGGAGA